MLYLLEICDPKQCKPCLQIYGNGRWMN